MTFQDQVKHPKWQKMRLEIFDRDNFACQDCGSTEKTLNVISKLKSGANSV